MSEGSVDLETLLRHRPFVRRLAIGLLGDEHAADDVVQETMLAALRRRRPPRRLRAWLGTVARNISLTQRRANRRRDRRERLAARGDATPATADAIEDLELQRRVVAAVLGLEEPYRSTVIDRYYRELPQRQIAAERGVAVQTVKTRLKRALPKLRERLDAEHGGRREVWVALLLPQGQKTHPDRYRMTCGLVAGALGPVGDQLEAGRVTRKAPRPSEGCVVFVPSGCLFSRGST